MMYKDYKKPAYEWLPDIPHHWQELFIQQVSHEQKNKNTGNIEGLVLSLSYGNIIRKKNVDAGLVAKDLSTYQIVDKNNIILRFTDLQNDHKSLRTGLVKERGIITSAYTCIVPTINAAYLHYVLHSYDTQKVFYGMGGGVRQSIGFDDIRHMFIPVPPREEQDQIVRYLDWQVSKINKLIHGYQREIKLLEERKKVIVDTVVTRGLNLSANTKDSGVYWLGSIPEHWNLIRAKYLFKKEKREPLPNDDVVTCFRDGMVTLRKNRRTTGFTESLQENGYQHVCKGDLVIHMMDAFAGSIGISDSNGKGTPVYHCCTPIQSDVYVPFFMYFLRMMAHTGYIQSLYRGIRERSTNFTFDVFSAQYLVCPPYNEQVAIVNYIESQSSKIEHLKRDINNHIVLLREYRTRLISDVVTGQMDVRGIEIPDYTPETDVEEEPENEDTNEEEADTDAE